MQSPESMQARRKGNASAPNADSSFNLSKLLQALQSVRDGDFSARLPSDQTGLAGKVADTFNEIVAANQRLAFELERVGQIVGKDGKTRHRMSSERRSGAWGAMEHSVNTLIDDLLWPTTEVTRTIAAVAKGDLQQAMNLEVDGRPLKGEFLRSATIVNTMIAQMSAFTSEVTRVAREVGTEGKLGGQAAVHGVAGTWKDLTDSVNSMASNLTGQVRNISEVTIAVANGDLSRKITVDVRGEILQLKEAINTMVDQLRSFASEVTRVAREVGTEGKLGGQAIVSGVAGTWKDLTDSVNAMAQANTALEAQKTLELETLNASLQRANADLERANQALQSEVGERTRAEQALKEADRHKDEFLAMLAHELRNPLAPIRNAVHLMKMKTTDDPQVCLSRDIIERQLSHLTRLVDDLLDVSRITRGKINLTRQRLEVGDLIDRAVETVEPAIQARRHRLSIEIVDRAHAVYGDPLRLTQAIANILGNAAKYTECGGHIDVRCRRRNRDIEIVVRDTGIGIAPEVLPRIFDLFTQLEHRMERSPSGLGIGLALVRRLVEMHGGTVTAHSEGPGCGSEFVVRLPLSIERTEGPGGEISAADQQTMVSDGRRILIADDNVDALESLATLLSLNGHQVFRASDGEAALRVVERLKPEIALLDIGMPRLDGYEVARRIRTLDGGHNIMLVALTGWGQESDRRRAQEAGFDAHLTKPVDLDKLGQLLGEGSGRSR